MSAPVVGPLDPSLRDGFDVARDLGVDPAVGLSSTDAARRLGAEGPDELQQESPVPLWRKVLAQFRNPLIYPLLVAIAIALLPWMPRVRRACTIEHTAAPFADHGRPRRRGDVNRVHQG